MLPVILIKLASNGNLDFRNSLCNYLGMPELLSAYDNLTEFTFDGRAYTVAKTGEMAVANGVICDTYEVPEVDDEWDLGIIKVEPGASTPRQLVIGGTRTVEAHLAGSGWLMIAPGLLFESPDRHVFNEDEQPGRHVDVRQGEVMQWVVGTTGLVAAELCWPPYQDGRFLDLP